MNVQETDRTLGDSIEKMGVYLTKHPSGTLIVTFGGERVFIYPHEGYWNYEIFEGQKIKPYKEGFFFRTEVQKFALMLLHWSWKMGAHR